jgi:Periplasmic molybdate-binding protein/domain
LLHGVAVKPGKPMLVGRLDRADGGESAYVGLPGYPVSALTIFRTFVAPAIREAAGLPEPRTATVDGRMAVRERYAEGRLRLMPVGLLDLGGGRNDTPAVGAAATHATEEADGASVTDATDAADDLPGDPDRPLVYPVDKGSGATTSLVEADGVVAVDPDTEYLDAGEPVSVRLFSPDVRPPTLLGVGEDDPAVNRLLDRLANPRYLPVGSREGLRRLRDGVPDVAVTAGPTARDVDTVALGGWDREWGIVVPEGNPAAVAGIEDLVERDLRFVNRPTDAGLRQSLDDAVADLAAERDASRTALTDRIDGYGLTLRAFESPARTVDAGDADAGLGLRETADRLGCGFVPLGTQSVVVRAAADRVDRQAVASLSAELDAVDELVSGLAGYSPR